MRFLLVASFALMLSACGTLVGAGAGGLAGNQFGHGSGKTAATAAGVIGGGVLGHALTGD
ncbi:MAG TPA: glycine zipper 2TM domain-containing protein [Stellaceae bacterium]|nr:glycine zipper 2TM domain-containing protein [Stellaceae bacterium]